MKIQLTILIAGLSLATSVFAAPETFDFKDPKGINNAGFKLDAPLESINGSASGIRGTVAFDPENPAATKGKIVVAANSLILPNPMQQGHMRGDKWLDVAKYPEISFDAKELKNVKTEGDVTSADAVGTFTCKGVAKDMTVPVKLTFLKDKLSQRVPKMNGDLLVIRSNFSIKRGDFNINPGQMEDKVSEDIAITLSIAGASAK
ncbi:MAG TPA: YceI family protein [Verrucomicrobiae bacterium]|jgi:polyisoprenoid-binding protein YceI|nr:YceI family protein [Verrucomicrobiae bacterium]